MLSVFQMTFAFLLLSLAVGCGRHEMAPVEGTVTISGAPATGGMIVFSPTGEADKDAPNSTGVVQSDGSFVLSGGAVVGMHSVTLVEDETPSGGASGEDDEDELESGVYSLVATATVRSADNHLNIDFPARTRTGSTRARLRSRR